MSELDLRFYNSAHGVDYVMRAFRHDGLSLQFLDSRWPTITSDTGEALGHPVAMLDISEIPSEAATRGMDIDTSGGWKVSAEGIRACQHALRASGLIPEPDEAVSGYLLISADAPLCGKLSHHPAWAPDDDGGHDARSWFEAYGAERTLEAALKEAEEDHASSVVAYEEEDLSDVPEMDVPFSVRVHPDGSLEILQFLSVDPEEDMICRYEAGMIYEAFGMDLPETDQGPEMAG